MSRSDVANSFRSGLQNSDSFSVECVNEYVWEVRSDLCIIRFLFNREDDDYYLEIQEAEENIKSKPMHFLLLSFLRRAYDEDREDDSPEYYSYLMNNFFTDVMDGDCSIREMYESYYKDFYEKLMYACNLPEDNPISKKIANYDISWVDDMRLG